MRESEAASKTLFEQELNSQQTMMTAVKQLATINFEELSINETLTVLLNAMKQISQLREQWGRIHRFFQKLATETESTQQVCINNKSIHELIIASLDRLS